MIRKTPTVAALPGLADQSVKLQTLRPVHVLTNIEHVGEFLYWYLQVPIVGLHVAPWPPYRWSCKNKSISPSWKLTSDERYIYPDRDFASWSANAQK